MYNIVYPVETFLLVLCLSVIFIQVGSGRAPAGATSVIRIISSRRQGGVIYFRECSEKVGAGFPSEHTTNQKHRAAF
jgi:hypothetical protein